MNKLDRSSRRFNIVLSILIAVLLWFYVVNVENPTGETTIPGVPVALQGTELLAERGLLVTELEQDTVNIKAVGKRKTFLKLYKSDLTLVLDLSEITEPGSYTMIGRVTPDYLRSDSSVSLSEKDGFAVDVTVKKRASRSIPLVGEFHGSLAAGHEMDPIRLSPTTIEVTGPEDVMQSIDKAVVLLTGENLKETKTTKESFVLVDTAGEVIKEESLSYSVEQLEATLPVVKIYELPLTLNLRPGGGAAVGDAEQSISPARVKLSGPEEILSKMTSISLGEVDLAEVFSSKTQVFPILLPEGVTCRSGESEATATVSIELPMKSVSTTQIDIANAPRGYQVSVVGESLQVWLRGEQSALDQVNGEQLRVVVDLADISVKRGQQRVEASVSLDGVTGVGVVGSDYNLAINLTK